MMTGYVVSWPWESRCLPFGTAVLFAMFTCWIAITILFYIGAWAHRDLVAIILIHHATCIQNIRVTLLFFASETYSFIR
jgi:hypothetical protein